MSDYNKPKLWESLKADGVCVVCGDELERGFPGYSWKIGDTYHVACPSHKPDAVIDAVEALKGGDREKTRPHEQQALSEALKGLDESLARIAHLLEQLYANGGLPK